jgi:hypothetical protein
LLLLLLLLLLAAEAATGSQACTMKRVTESVPAHRDPVQLLDDVTSSDTE